MEQRTEMTVVIFIDFSKEIRNHYNLPFCTHIFYWYLHSSIMLPKFLQQFLYQKLQIFWASTSDSGPVSSFVLLAWWESSLFKFFMKMVFIIYSLGQGLLDDPWPCDADTPPPPSWQGHEISQTDLVHS